MSIYVDRGNNFAFIRSNRRAKRPGARKASTPSYISEVLPLLQLLPEVAESVSRADTVIFVDASCAGEAGELRCHRVTPPLKVQFTHQLSPAELLGLAGQDRSLHYPPRRKLKVLPEHFETELAPLLGRLSIRSDPARFGCRPAKNGR